jgi:FixJ family two-component response regulator
MSKRTAIVFVVDDDKSVRESLESLIRSTGLQVETYRSAREFLAGGRATTATQPSCLVLDIRLPGLSGIDLQEELLKLNCEIPIIFITGHGDIPTSVRAMKAGALEFLTKPFRDQDLLDAIEQALINDQAARERRAEWMELHQRYGLLTPRERQVMALVVEGLLNKQIAGRLGISEITVKVHRAQGMQKMRAASLAELVRLAERLGISPAGSLPPA